VDEGLKKRLIGATVLVSLVVIFVPMLLEKGPVVSTTITETNIPPPPPEGDFSSQVLPLEEPATPTEAAAPPASETAPLGAIDRGEPPAETSAPNTEEDAQPTSDLRVGLTAWVVQLGSFSLRENADRVAKDLQAKKFPAFVEPAEIGDKHLFRVLVGPEIDQKRAEQMLSNLEPEMKRWKLQGKLRSYP
jgi:DedD protein